MKILFITQFLPYFPDTGGKVKSWEILKQLSCNHEVWLASFVNKKENLVYEKEVNKICQEVKTFFQPIITLAYRSLKFKAFLSLFGFKPFRAYKHYSFKMARYLQKITKENKFDIIYIDHDVMSQYLDYIFLEDKLVVFDQHNISSSASWRNFKIEKNLATKGAYFLETIKWYFYEKKYLKYFDRIFTISEADKEKLVSMGLSRKKIDFLPIPMEVQNLYRSDNINKNILFVGLMSWKPNADGFWWFYKEVYPLIKKAIKNISFTVIGAYPSKEMTRMSKEDKNLNVLGYVKNIEGFYKKASIFVVPIRSGGGIRIKILKALSYGMPVVSTRMGAEGISLINNKQILLADNHKDFARQIINLITNPLLAQKLNKQGMEFVKCNYNYLKAKDVLDFLSRDK